MIRLPDTFEEAVGLALKEWRARRGVTQVEAAELAGVSQPTFSRIERGLSGMDLETAYTLLGTAGVGELVERAVALLAAREAVDDAVAPAPTALNLTPHA